MARPKKLERREDLAAAPFTIRCTQKELDDVRRKGERLNLSPTAIFRCGAALLLSLADRDLVMLAVAAQIKASGIVDTSSATTELPR